MRWYRARRVLDPQACTASAANTIGSHLEQTGRVGDTRCTAWEATC